MGGVSAWRDVGMVALGALVVASAGAVVGGTAYRRGYRLTLARFPTPGGGSVQVGLCTLSREEQIRAAQSLLTQGFSRAAVAESYLDQRDSARFLRELGAANASFGEARRVRLQWQLGDAVPLDPLDLKLTQLEQRAAEVFR